tara:strand:- start:108 stop:245 length:138 start_codon:yes stop_codon:yes gene_type:complete
MQTRNNSDRRDTDRRIENLPINTDRRIAQRRSGFDRRAMLASEMA